MIGTSVEAQTVSVLNYQTFARQLERGIGVRIGPFNARVRILGGELGETLYDFYRDYPILADDTVHHFHVTLEFRRGWPQMQRRLVRLSVDGRQPHDDMPAEQALPVFEWGLNLVIALRSQNFLMLHAAVVERNGAAMLLPAAPGYGKTTLCAALSLCGWRTLSDEFGLLRPSCAEMIPVPRPMALKNASIDVIRARGANAMIGPATPNTRKGTVAHLKPSSDSIARQGTRAPVSLIVFPRWVRDSDTILEEMTKSEAFMYLASNAFNYEMLGEAAYRAVRDLVGGAECYRFQYSDLDEATALFNELADSRAR